MNFFNNLRYNLKSNYRNYHNYLFFSPVVLLVLIPFIVELPLSLLGISTDPIWLWYRSGIVSGVGPGIIDGFYYLDSSINSITQALGHLAAYDWISGKVPWWNPYSGLGMPLAGEMQPGALFLPFILLLLLHNGILWLKIAVQIIGGLSTYALLRELGLGRFSALIGGILFELNGTFAWSPGPASVYCAAAFLPLLLYGIVKSSKVNGRIGIFWIAVALAYSLLAGFPEVAYIDGLFALMLAIYLFFITERRLNYILRIVYGGFLGLLLGAPIIVAFADFLHVSNAFSLHEFGKISIPLEAVPTVILPYVFGPLGERYGSSTLSNIWSLIGGYSDITIIFMAILGLTWKKYRMLSLLLLFWIVLSLSKTFGIEPFATIMNHIPLILDARFTRYSAPSWELALIILAMFGLESLSIKQPKVIIPSLIAIFLIILSIYLAWPFRSFWGWSSSKALIMAENLAISVLFGMSGLMLLVLFLRKFKGQWLKFIVGLLLIINAFIFFAFPELAGRRPGHIDMPALIYLKNNLGLSRFYTVWPIQPNYGAYFRIASINYSSSVPNSSNFRKFVRKNLTSSLSKSGDTFFYKSANNNIGTYDVYRFFKNYEATGVKYILTNSKKPLNALKNKILGIKLVYHDSLMDIYKLPNPSSFYSITSGGQCKLTSEKISSLRAACKSGAILIRRELYMPGWHAVINGKRKPVLSYKKIFESVKLPAGKSSINFYFIPPYINYALAGFILGIIGLSWEFAVFYKSKDSRNKS
jgi:hypothetical protein